jgi:nucleotide-binding universal stress UspA family protein
VARFSLLFDARPAARFLKVPGISEVEMKRILVGVDGSREATAAVEAAAGLARSVGANVMLAYVVPRRPPPGPASFAPDLARADNLEQSHAAGLLREAEMRCTSAGVPVDSETLVGPVAERLAHLAESDGYDLVVVGHRGRGGVTRALLGSVADRLLQLSSRPVLVVR